MNGEGKNMEFGNTALVRRYEIKRHFANGTAAFNNCHQRAAV
jgi:hypothetical protein